MNILKAIFGSSDKEDLGALIKEGALVLDVRTPDEFKSGHADKAKNIPLAQLKGKLSSLDKKQTIITCCASGMRSGSARKVLLASGFEKVINGGPWTNLKN